jgi:toxin-antitoxin system PIN domain toxin
VFTNTYLFPDVNVWLALAHEIHPQHRVAIEWDESLDSGTILSFCRFTQLGLLRLLTNPSAMGTDALTQSKAWAVYDAFLRTNRARLIEEPRGIESIFRQYTNRNEVSTKQWADGYLSAFALASSMPIVTFDRALAGKVKGAVLLG